jgi:hypothetical protein
VKRPISTRWWAVIAKRPREPFQSHFLITAVWRSWGEKPARSSSASGLITIKPELLKGTGSLNLLGWRRKRKGAGGRLSKQSHQIFADVSARPAVGCRAFHGIIIVLLL